MAEYSKLACVAISLIALACLPSLISWGSSAQLSFQSSQPSFGTPNMSILYARPGRIWASSQWQSLNAGNFTVRLYAGLSSDCYSDTLLAQTGTGIAPLLPPNPAGFTQNNTGFIRFWLYPANNINESGTIEYVCVYVNDSTGLTRNSTAYLVDFSRLPPSTTTTISTTSTSSVPTSSTFATTTLNYTTTTHYTTSATTSIFPPTTTAITVSCGCVCSGACVHPINITQGPSTTYTTTTVTSTMSSTTIYMLTTSVYPGPSQSLIDIITSSEHSPYQPTVSGSLQNIINVIRWILGIR